MLDAPWACGGRGGEVGSCSGNITCDWRKSAMFCEGGCSGAPSPWGKGSNSSELAPPHRSVEWEFYVSKSKSLVTCQWQPQLSSHSTCSWGGGGGGEGGEGRCDRDGVCWCKHIISGNISRENVVPLNIWPRGEGGRGNRRTEKVSEKRKYQKVLNKQTITKRGNLYSTTLSQVRQGVWL